MLTYVINTSENKVLKTDLLFELVGYNKIAWMRSPLAHIEDCAEGFPALWGNSSELRSIVLGRVLGRVGKFTVSNSSLSLPVPLLH